jgi:hypothetical protein
MDINQSEIDQLISQTEALSWNDNPPLLHLRQLPSHLHSNIKSILAEMDAAQQKPPSPENLVQEAHPQGVLQEQLRRRKILWKQKSRETWLTCKGLNTKYFHASMVIRRKYNSISFIKKKPLGQMPDWVGKRKSGVRSEVNSNMSPYFNERII